MYKTATTESVPPLPIGMNYYEWACSSNPVDYFTAIFCQNEEKKGERVLFNGRVYDYPFINPLPNQWIRISKEEYESKKKALVAARRRK